MVHRQPTAKSSFDWLKYESHVDGARFPIVEWKIGLKVILPTTVWV